jgi:cob(I)alamin adenosyltransferase
MVRLTKIYTRTGDDGTTGVVGPDRLSKTDPRIEAIGAVDEANAAIGLALAALVAAPGSDSGSGGIADALRRAQNDLFDLGADLATPGQQDGALRILPEQTARLEREIDAFNARLAPLESFILPGGSELAARLHLARTVARRAERRVFTLMQAGAVSAEPARYLNRLSDLLFVLARVANDDGAADVLWVPGGER